MHNFFKEIKKGYRIPQRDTKIYSVTQDNHLTTTTTIRKATVKRCLTTSKRDTPTAEKQQTTTNYK